MYNQGFDGTLAKNTIEKLRYDAIDDEAIAKIEDPSYVNLMKVAIENSDAAIIGSEEIPKELEEYLNTIDKPVLKYHNMENFSQAYLDFYSEKVLK